MQDEGRNVERGPDLSGDWEADAINAVGNMAEVQEEKVGGEPEAWWVAAATENGLMIGSNTGEHGEKHLLAALIASMGPGGALGLFMSLLSDAPAPVLQQIRSEIDKRLEDAGQPGTFQG